MMERAEAIDRIKLLIGQDLRSLAETYEITVWKSPGKKNKGWAGHVIERYLGLAMNSSRSPNFGSWELKVIPLKYRKEKLIVKETMAITMIDQIEVKAKDFEDSHLFMKLRKMVVVSRVFVDQNETSSPVHNVATFDLDDPELLVQVKADYDLIRSTLINHGFDALTGRMGSLVQPRTKGPGHGSRSRAFYARSQFVTRILGLGG